MNAAQLGSLEDRPLNPDNPAKGHMTCSVTDPHRRIFTIFAHAAHLLVHSCCLHLGRQEHRQTDVSASLLPPGRGTV